MPKHTQQPLKLKSWQKSVVPCYFVFVSWTPTSNVSYILHPTFERTSSLPSSTKHFPFAAVRKQITHYSSFVLCVAHAQVCFKESGTINDSDDLYFLLFWSALKLFCFSLNHDILNVYFIRKEFPEVFLNKLEQNGSDMLKKRTLSYVLGSESGRNYGSRSTFEHLLSPEISSDS